MIHLYNTALAQSTNFPNSSVSPSRTQLGPPRHAVLVHGCNFQWASSPVLFDHSHSGISYIYEAVLERVQCTKTALKSIFSVIFLWFFHHSNDNSIRILKIYVKQKLVHFSLSFGTLNTDGSFFPSFHSPRPFPPPSWQLLTWVLWGPVILPPLSLRVGRGGDYGEGPSGHTQTCPLCTAQVASENGATVFLILYLQRLSLMSRSRGIHLELYRLLLRCGMNLLV